MFNCSLNCINRITLDWGYEIRVAVKRPSETNIWRMLTVNTFEIKYVLPEMMYIDIWGPSQLMIEEEEPQIEQLNIDE